MYAENLTVSKDIFTNPTTSYSDILCSIMEYTETYYALESCISLFEANNTLKAENNTDQSSGNTDNANTNNSNIGDTLKAYSAKLVNIFQKIVGKFKEYLATIWNKLKELMGKIQEQMEKIGVEKSLENIKANPKAYKFDEGYYNEKIENAEFVTPRSDQIIKAYQAVAKKYIQCSGELGTRDPDGLSTPVTDKDKEELKNLQSEKKKGSDFKSDGNTDYFSQNVEKSLGLVQGLFASLKSNKFEQVCGSFIDDVKTIHNNVANNGKSISRSIDVAAKKNDAAEVKKWQARAKALISIGNEAVTLSGNFRSQIIQMNLSRLKIINTFIRLWKLQQNEPSAENKEAKKEEPKEKPSENVSDATSAP